MHVHFKFEASLSASLLKAVHSRWPLAEYMRMGRPNNFVEFMHGWRLAPQTELMIQSGTPEAVFKSDGQMAISWKPALRYSSRSHAIHREEIQPLTMEELTTPELFQKAIHHLHDLLNTAKAA